MEIEKKVLICNDSPSETRLLKGILRRSGFVVDAVADPSSIIATLMWKRHNVCLISFSHLSSFNALKIASSIYEKKLPSEVGIILTGKRKDSYQLAEALENYADAVVSIPADLPLLSGVVSSLIRREITRNSNFYATTSEKIVLGRSVIDTGKRTLVFGSKRFSFTKSQFQLFMLLLTHKDQTLSRAEIIKSIKGDYVFLESRTVDNTIYQLRKKLKKSCFLIDTVSGLGYCMSVKDV